MAVASRPVAKHEITMALRLRLQNLESGLGHQHVIRTVVFSALARSVIMRLSGVRLGLIASIEPDSTRERTQ